jgi:hypothetical protein
LGPREFLNPKDLWKQEGTKNNESPETFEGPENPWRPNKPIFLYFLKYICQPIASSALLHFPGYFLESLRTLWAKTTTVIWPGPNH